MSLIASASAYVLDLLMENEEVKKFPQDFITASMQWVRTWFLVDDDPVTKTILEAKDQAAPVKKAILEAKLKTLLDNPTFAEELKGQLVKYEQQRAKIKNVLGENAEIDATGNVRIGDQGAAVQDEGYDEKNVVKGKIKSGGNVTIGDTSFQVEGNVNKVVNNYYGAASAPGEIVPPEATKALKDELRKFIADGRSDKAIERLADLNNEDEDFNNQAFALSGRWSQLKRQENMGIIDSGSAGVERAKINHALLNLIGEL